VRENGSAFVPVEPSVTLPFDLLWRVEADSYACEARASSPWPGPQHHVAFRAMRKRRGEGYGTPVRSRIRSRRVVSPSGTEWRVGRVWLARPAPRVRRVWKRDAGDVGWDWVPFDLGDWADLEAVILIAIALVLVVFVIVPLLLFGVELIVVGGALAASIIGRLLFGRPWIVRAESLGGTREVLSWRVSGWRGSERAMDEIAQALAAGSNPEPQGAGERMLAP
jgi:hypothetical protein